MSQFSFNDYQNAVSAAQNKNSNVKVGFFKLASDGDEALVRINASTADDLQFASVHTISAGGKWLKVSCLNPLGSYNDSCELCRAVASGNTTVSKASKKVYIQMLVSYKDKATGQFSAPVPVVWERPAGFSRELVNKLRDYGDLKQVLLKVTRNGAAGDMKTTYSLDYAVPTVYKPEMIPADFSAFNNFKINKHSYWEKTPEEIHTFLTTGAFPEIAKSTEAPVVAASTSTGYTPTIAAPVQTPVQPVYTQPTAQASTDQKPVDAPRNFNGFSF